MAKTATPVVPAVEKPKTAIDVFMDTLQGAITLEQALKMPVKDVLQHEHAIVIAEAIEQYHSDRLAKEEAKSNALATKLAEEEAAREHATAIAMFSSPFTNETRKVDDNGKETDPGKDWSYAKRGESGLQLSSLLVNQKTNEVYVRQGASFQTKTQKLTRDEKTGKIHLSTQKKLCIALADYGFNLMPVDDDGEIE